MRDLLTLQDRMNRLFEEATDVHSRAEEEADVDMERADWVPAADIYESDGEYAVVLDLPGIQRDALDVQLEQGRLTIRGEKAAVSEDKISRRTERPSGRFVRSFTVPEAVDRERIEADYKDGVLHLRLPKLAEQKPRKVKVEIR
jgi:HSP20 family protein